MSKALDVLASPCPSAMLVDIRVLALSLWAASATCAALSANSLAAAFVVPLRVTLGDHVGERCRHTFLGLLPLS